MNPSALAATRGVLAARSILRQALCASPLSKTGCAAHDSARLWSASMARSYSTSPTTAATSASAASGTAAGAAAGTNTSGGPRREFEVDTAGFHDYTLEDLLRARVHMGHRTGLLHRNMRRYVLGSRNGLDVINLDATAEHLRRALTAASLMAEHDCTFLWLAPGDAQKARLVERAAVRAGAFTIDGARWIGGTLTNPIMSRQAQRFNYRVPDCLFVIDVNRHTPALREAQSVGIPTIGVVDSDCDPRLLTYPIPGNDDGGLAVALYCNLMRHAILDGRKRGRRLNRPSLKIPVLESTQQRSRQQRYRQRRANS